MGRFDPAYLYGEGGLEVGHALDKIRRGQIAQCHMRLLPHLPHGSRPVSVRGRAASHGHQPAGTADRRASRDRGHHRSPAPENEGCYLQGAIPHTARRRGPGHYATDPAQHLVEGCAYDTAGGAPTHGSGLGPLVRSPAHTMADRKIAGQPDADAALSAAVSDRTVRGRSPASAIMAAALAKWVDGPASQLVDYALALTTWWSAMRLICTPSTVRYEDLVAGRAGDPKGAPPSWACRQAPSMLPFATATRTMRIRHRWTRVSATGLPASATHRADGVGI